MRGLLRIAGLAALILAIAAPTVGAAVTSEQAIAFLNQQRSANGLPGDLVSDPSLALGCRQHDRYMQGTGIFDHGESPESPYYTPEGAGQGPFGGGSEVLASGDGYGPTGANPWETAPIHLYLMLSPSQSIAGYDASGGYACMRLRDDRPEGEQPEAPRFFSYPGPGTSGIYPEEWASERPYVPQQLVGIPADQVTGPNILLFSLGAPEVKAESYSLTGPAGPVAARMVDETTRNEVGSGFWFRGGGVLIPEHPLSALTTYSVKILWRAVDYVEWGAQEEVRRFTQEFSFTTGPSTIRKPTVRPPVHQPRLRMRRLSGTGRVLSFRLTAGKLLRGRNAYVSVLRQERGCGESFATGARRCGWKLLGRRQVSVIRLKRSQLLHVRGPELRQKLDYAVKTRPFKRNGERYSAAAASVEIRR